MATTVGIPLLELESDSGETFPVENPATGETIAEVPRMGAAETRRAIARAEEALPAWRSMLAKDRARILRRSWNFPAAMPTRKSAPALAAGCTMVLKPAEQTPLTAMAVARLGLEAGLPEGVFQLVTGDTEDAPTIGGELTGNPIVLPSLGARAPEAWPHHSTRHR